MKLKTILSFILIAVIIGSCVETTDEEKILDRLAVQVECWNTGDIECFMIGYWESDSLMFISDDGITYGYYNTLQRYQTNYPDVQSMGTLRFNIQHINRISKDTFFVVGQFYLRRTIGDKEGSFTLLWKKINGSWVIVADHSS